MNKLKCKYCKHNIRRTDLLCNFCGCLTTSSNAYETILEMKPLFKKLNDKVNSLRKIINSEKIPFDDQRNQVLGSLSYMIAWVMIQQDIFYQFARRKNDPIPNWVRKTNPNMSNDDMINFLWNYDNMNRRSFLTNFLFQIELLLEEINKILKTPTPDQGYKVLTKHIIKELPLKNIDHETFRKLYFPAIVRNAMHMNGIHTENDNNGKIDGILFKFKKGGKVRYGSWRHTYFFCDNILDVVEKILKSKYLKGKSMKMLKGN